MQADFDEYACKLLQLVREVVRQDDLSDTCIKCGWDKIMSTQALSWLFLSAYTAVCGKPETEDDWTVADDIFDAITRKVYHARLNVVVREFQLTKTGRIGDIESSDSLRVQLRQAGQKHSSPDEKEKEKMKKNGEKKRKKDVDKKKKKEEDEKKKEEKKKKKKNSKKKEKENSNSKKKEGNKKSKEKKPRTRKRGRSERDIPLDAEQKAAAKKRILENIKSYKPIAVSVTVSERGTTLTDVLFGT